MRLHQAATVLSHADYICSKFPVAVRGRPTARSKRYGDILHHFQDLTLEEQISVLTKAVKLAESASSMLSLLEVKQTD